MRLTFLGTGTSFGVPVIGCRCGVCTSQDPRDRRTRHGAMLSLDEGRLLVDTPPELRLQLLREGVTEVDAVWYTHLHADHLHGIDDLRIFTMRRGRNLPAFVAKGSGDALFSRFPYIFTDPMPPLADSPRPEIELRAFDPGRPVEILGHSFQPLPVPHGAITVYGFRVADLGYITDGKLLTPTTRRLLEGVKVLVLNALWSGNPHPTHFNLEEAIRAAAEVGASRTFLTHLTHYVRHEEVSRQLPPGMELAYDGLSVEIG